jgi:hypothetical protein
MPTLSDLRARARRCFACCAAAALSLALVNCGGSGNSSPTTNPVGTTISFAGSQITNNTMTLECEEQETFTIEQANYTGNFTVVDNYPNLGNNNNVVTLTPSTGAVGTTFTIEFISGSATTFTVTATNGSGLVGTLTVNVVC